MGLTTTTTNNNKDTTFLWNSVIRGYEKSRMPWEAIYLYSQMVHNHVSPDKFTYPFVLKACAAAGGLREAQQVHSRIAKSPHRLDMFVQCSLIDVFARCGHVKSARDLFDGLPHKNVVCWNVMIDGYVKNGDVVSARSLFDMMLERDLFSWNEMIGGYVRVGRIEDARKLFDEMVVRDVVTWNSMVDGYARFGDMAAAMELFGRMPFMKDAVTWGVVLNGLAKCGRVDVAHALFEKLPYRNSVTWNSLIHGYVRCNHVDIACKLFELTPCRSLTSWNIMLDACVKGEEIEIALCLFNEMPVRDVVSWNIMIDGYARAGNMRIAQELFDCMPSRDVVSWNALIVGYKQNGQPKKVIELYSSMQLAGEKPDCSTLVTVLSTAGDLGLFYQGRWVHAYIRRNKIPVDGIIGVALIDMYSKCGHVDTALEIFNSISHKTRDHWNAMISGAAIHGYGTLAVSLFEQVEHSMVVPDDITFIATLNACSHAGLIREGHRCFEIMSSKYNIIPKIQHYGCMVDLLSRAGHLEAAMTLVRNMPMTPNDVVWRALLGASRSHGNTEIAEHAARHLIELVPYDSSSYVLLSNIFGLTGQLGSARNIWKAMKARGVVKTPGCSSIEVNGSVHEFTVGDSSHPDILDIHVLLSKMSQELILDGYLPDRRHSVLDTDEEMSIPSSFKEL